MHNPDPIASLKPFDSIWRILIRWKGSVYKLLWLELLVFAALFHIIQAVYNHVLDETQKRTFERLHNYCNSSTESFPISFFLGFYVTLVVGRWWNQYLAIPWPDSLLMILSANVKRDDESSRKIRFHIACYILATFVLYLVEISPPVKKRYPSKESLVEVDLLTRDECKIIEAKEEETGHLMIHLPMIWAAELVTKALEKNCLIGQFTTSTLVDRLESFRFDLGRLIGYGSVTVPLAYSQTVIFVAYSYFGAKLIGGQFVANPTSAAGGVPTFNIYIPIFLYLQYLFFMGTLRAAQSLLNPFGSDDQDFDMNLYVNRNILIVLATLQSNEDDRPAVFSEQNCGKSFDLCKALAKKCSRRNKHKAIRVIGEKCIEME